MVTWNRLASPGRVDMKVESEVRGVATTVNVDGQRQGRVAMACRKVHE